MTEPRAPGDKGIYQRIARVGEAIEPGLTDRDVERLIAGAGRRRTRRAARRVVLAVALAGAGTAALVLQVGAPAVVAPIAVAPGSGVASPRAPIAATGTPPSDAPLLRSARALRLADGSVATPADEQSGVTVVEDTPRRVALDLPRGRARFEVVPAVPARPFVVRAGDVTITVLGTVFSVERVADRIGVTVERGKVLVDWGRGHRTLAAAESGWFPPLVVGAAATEPEPIPAPRTTRSRALRETPPAAEVAPPPVDRSIAAAATSPTAPPAFPSLQPPAVPSAPQAVRPVERDSAESLLAAADAARLAGRPADGAALLRRVLQEDRADPRAPLAAFTLGRLLLMELGRPREAAAAFAEARALAPAGPFAEDALAREVEAWAKAGASVEARARARDYLRLYPDGRRAPAVKALGGGE